MEFYRSHRSGASAQSRFLGVLARPGGDSISGNSGVELHEDEVFWSGSDTPEPIVSPKATSPAMLAAENPNPRSSLYRRIPEKNSGILAALVEDEKKRRGADAAGPPLLQRKPSTASSSASTSPSSASSARMIPAIPKPKTDYGGGKLFLQSAPVNIPIPPRFARDGHEASGGAAEADEAVQADEDDDEMLPPHEIIARRSGMGNSVTSFSVLEGIGRTLKGRDLRQVRNAVFLKTGFLD